MLETGNFALVPITQPSVKSNTHRKPRKYPKNHSTCCDPSSWESPENHQDVNCGECGQLGHNQRKCHREHLTAGKRKLDSGSDYKGKDDDNQKEDDYQEDDDDDDAEHWAELAENGQAPSFEAVLGVESDELLTMKADKLTPAEVYQSIKDHIGHNYLPFSSPLSVTSTICDDEQKCPNNQSGTCADQQGIYQVLWVIMERYQKFVKQSA